jgi:hypothetical protein
LSEEQLPPAGYHDGTIVDAWLEENEQYEDSLTVVFNVDLEGGENIECRHRIEGKHADLNKEILHKLGVENWPDDLERTATITQSADVRVKITHATKRSGEEYYRAYITFGGPAQRVENVKDRIAKLKDIPF